MTIDEIKDAIIQSVLDAGDGNCRICGRTEHYHANQPHLRDVETPRAALDRVLKACGIEIVPRK